jgi:hypothetical protein
MASTAELLQQVETAISNCLTAQSYTVAGRQKTMAQLRELREFRQQLKDELSIENSGSGSMSTLLTLGEPTI